MLSKQKYTMQQQQGFKIQRLTSMERIGEEPEEHVGREESSAVKSARPVQRESEEKVDIDDVLQKLKVLFSYYASFGDRLNVTNLKASKFHKMMQDAQVEVKPAHKKRIDLIFCSQNKNMPNMGFDTFLDSLPLIAQLKYPEIVAEHGHGTTLNCLLQNDILPLYEKLSMSQTHLRIQQRYDVELTEGAVIVLRSIEETLYEIYATYFPWEQVTSDAPATVANRSIKAAFQFLNEFEVCPAILSKTVVFNILMSVLNDPTEPPTSIVPLFPGHTVGGTVLNFAKFLYLIVKIAYFAYDGTAEGSVTGGNYSVAERLCFLLERMELSNGFVNLEKKTNRPHTARTSLLPPDQIIMKVMQERGQSERSEERPLESSEHIPEEPIEKAGKAEEYGSENLEHPPTKEGPEVASEIVDKYNEQLYNLFQRYCSYGEPLNTTRLKSAKFLKILKDCGLVSGQPFGTSQSRMGTSRLKSVDADLIYTKVTGIKLPTDMLQAGPSMSGMSIMMSTMGGPKLTERPSTSPEKGPKILDFNRKRTTPSTPIGRMMDFEQFISALHLIGQKIMPEMDPGQSFERLVEDWLLPLDRGTASERAVSNDTLVALMDLIKEKEMAKFLGVVHKSLYPYYKTYCGPKGQLSLEGFMRFCTDFGIFPDIVTKPRLHRIFYTIASIYTTGGPSRSRMETGEGMVYIDDNFFVQAIALCALEVPYKEPQPTNFEKVF
eukprot:TRINITY_DN368_c4_g1_i1.p2 TRINITY_DN368_c4_g1~~TRINITY_DN368_c4_g1_i1.p2  ORF type:complete len:718 (-),score=69.14 TRINITY_DN368_c4_g1_i1:6194-8347(-)